MQRFLSSNSLWLAVMAGVLHAAAFPPIGWWPLVLVSLVPLLLFVRNETRWWRLVLGSYLYCGIYALYTIIWMPDPLLIGVGVTLFTLAFVPGVLLAKRFVQHSALFFTVAASAVIAGELAGGYFLFLPAFFIMSGIPLAGTPLQYVAVAGGVIGASVFAVLWNAAFACVALAVVERRRSLVLLGAGALVVLVAVPFVARLFVGVQHQALPMRVMAVSAGDVFDAGVERFDDRALLLQQPGALEAFRQFLTAHLAPIGDAVDRERPDLLVLPEDLFNTELPGFAFEPARASLGITNNGPVLEALSELAQTHHVWLMTALVTFDASGHKYITSVLIDPSGQFVGQYHKHYLTIISEYWPYGHWMPFYWKWEYKYMPPAIHNSSFIADNPTGLFTAGGSTPTVYSVRGAAVGSVICGEGQLPYAYWSRAAQGDQFIVYTGSTSWLPLLRGLYEGLSLHLRRLESLNTGLPIVISASGERPSVIYPDGSMVSGTPLTPSGWSYVTQ